MASKFAFDHPDDAMRGIAEKLAVVGIERGVDIGHCGGRVLAKPVTADRDSPAADVSAMDGYAIRLSQLQLDAPARVIGQSVPGSPPPQMPNQGVVQIFTGAIIPTGAEAVVKREDTIEGGGEIRFRKLDMPIQMGENIRRAGENAKSGSQVISPRIMITAAEKAVAVNFGCFECDVYAPVKVGIITTGDEVGLFLADRPKPWQLQNSNRFALEALLENKPSIDHVASDHCRDDKDSLITLLGETIERCDVVLMTGGVSMGDYDHVPDVIRAVGGEVVFHGLPIRPGKPILGAATKEGKLILGLPGNPVSATIGGCRIAMPLIARLGGVADWLPKRPMVKLENAGSKTLPMHWMRLVRLTGHGRAEVVESRGSGDLVSMAKSDGFVEVPAMQSADTRGVTGPGVTASGVTGSGVTGSGVTGPWPFYAW